ncbi:MAG: sensor signal transduction histidine kinase [Marmoricola sp.]|nr:sensor signal transduction histidine kinase [Marmoricola sp.]
MTRPEVRPHRARSVLGTAAWAGAFVLAALLGRTTIIDRDALSLVWPAAGVSALWIGSTSGSLRRRSLLVLGGTTFLVNSLTGAPAALAAVFVVTNLVQVLTFVRLISAWVPDLWGFGGTAPLVHLRDLGRLTVAAVLSCLLGAALGTIGLAAVLGSTDVSSLLVWWGRNAVAVIVLVSVGVLAGRPLLTCRTPREAVTLVARSLRPRSALRVVEVALLLGASAGLYLILFLAPTAGPLAFLILVMSVWAGIRFSPLVVGLHGIAMGVTGIVFTLHGIGPFAEIASLHYRALAAQVFVAMAVLKGLALAFSRAERDLAILELAEARRASDERAQLLDAVLQSMKEGIVVIDESGAILVRNAAGRNLAGLVGEPAERLQPAATYGLFHENGLPVLDAELPGARALAGETVDSEDLHLRTATVPEGRVLEFSAQQLRSTDPSGLRRAMVNVRDVTLDRQHRDTLASFAGVVAHDLFNPLSVVDGWAEALADEFRQGPVSPAVGGLMVGRIHDAAEHMRDFIGDLMSYTIARDQSLKQGPVDLTAMVRSLAGLRTDVTSASLIVVGDDLQVWADTGLVRQLLDNLIGNAVKYVAAGTRPVVEVTGEAVGDWLEVRVADNGIGIPEHQREAVFETFHRAHGDGYRGTGLGLAICRRIVDRHGGTIHVAPGPRGTGSTFVFRLPLLAPAGTPVVPAQASASVL